MLLPLLVIAALGEAKTIIAAVGDSVTAGDHDRTTAAAATTPGPPREWLWR